MRRRGRSSSTPVRCAPRAPGWWCIADVADRVVERIVNTAGEWFPADPLLPDTKMGPLVDRAQPAAGARDISTAASRQGPAMRIGGQRVLAETGGAYLEPTVVTGAAPDNPLVREEIFGPVLAVQVVDDEAEAVRVAGDTPYGLAAAVWTSDLGTAHRVSRALRAGTVWVNCYEEGDMAVPVRRGQAVRLRPRQVPACSGGVHLPQDDLDPIWLTSSSMTCAAPDRHPGPLLRTRDRAAVRGRGDCPGAVRQRYSRRAVNRCRSTRTLRALSVDVDAARERLWFADGVLLPGGGDVAARWSGQQPHPTQYGVDEEQDAFDLAVARVALADHLPLLAICRGNQIVNVALGGDLVQDMDDTVGNHRNRVHDLDVDEDSPLGEIVGRRTAISCYHHQCIAALGAGLIPAAYSPTG